MPAKLYESGDFDVSESDTAAYLRTLPDPGAHHYTPVFLLLTRLPESRWKALTVHGVDITEKLKLYSSREIRAWGLTDTELQAINQALTENGYPPKLL